MERYRPAHHALPISLPRAPGRVQVGVRQRGVDTARERERERGGGRERETERQRDREEG